MQKLIKVLEDMMVAITFAEAGEYDDARKISMREEEPSSSMEVMKAKEA